MVLTGEGELGSFVIPGVGSDHWTICLEWARLGKFVKIPFRFEKFWMMHPDFKRLLTEWWKGFVEPEGSRMYVLQQKLNHIKDNLKKWNKESFGHILVEKLKLENQIGEIQLKVMKEGYIKEESTKEQELIKELV